MLNDKQKRLIARAMKVLEEQYSYSVNGVAFESPEQTAEYFKLKLSGEESEQFAIAFLDNRHRLISCDVMFSGTIDAASVYPREVVRRALEHNAAAVIFSHNHPSGIAEPSIADLRITEKLRDALALIGTRTLDHIIVGGTEHVSLAERGLI